MTKWILSILMVAGLSLTAEAQRIAGAFNVGNTNTTTAAVIIPPKSDAAIAKVTDIVGSTQGSGAYYNIFPGKLGYSINVAVSASTTNIFVANTSGITAGDSVIFEDDDNNTWERLVVENVPSTTNFNVTSAVTSAQPVNKRIYLTGSVIERYGVTNLEASYIGTNAVMQGPIEVYLPGGVASAVEIAGGTTATKLSVSGVYLGN